MYPMFLVKSPTASNCFVVVFIFGLRCAYFIFFNHLSTILSFFSLFAFVAKSPVPSMNAITLAGGLPLFGKAFFSAASLVIG